MNKYEVLGQAFEDVGMLMRDDLENLAETVEEDERFAVLYPAYASLLNVINATRTTIDDIFFEIENE